MTEVLSYSPQTDGSSHLGSTSLRRSSSQTSFFLNHPPSLSRSSNLQSTYPSSGYDIRLPNSIPSSAPSSPRLAQAEFSIQSSYLSTPSSSLSLDVQCDNEDHDILFPSYNDGGYYEQKVEQLPPPPPLLPAGPQLSDHPQSAGLCDTPLMAKAPTLTVTSRPNLSEPMPLAGDDTAVRSEPSRHVDYLSHDWKEEDIWSSWRHIVTKRKVYKNSPRLENASWRSWAKSKNRLKTVSPERLNWLKDHDVTWLYGPLQTDIRKSFHADSAPPASQISRTNSFTSKKPILKKRSLSEVMLQRSISSSTLMKQATDALQAQSPEKRTRDRPSLSSLSDGAVPSFILNSNPTTPGVGDLTESSTALQSASSSGGRSPGERRHIHFNDEVEQCIAINKDGDEAEEYFNIHDDDSSDDDGVIMMKSVPGRAKLSNRSTPRNSFSHESKTIAMLPSTTLKYRSDTPELVEPPSNQNRGFWDTAPKMAPSPSQETLRPSKPSTNFLLDDEDEEDLSWQPSGARRDSIFVHHDRLGTSRETEDENESPGLRRTPSGMFMPYEEDEDDVVAAGLFGRVVDTVNTAKDIAHVIWNVGWRR